MITEVLLLSLFVTVPPPATRVSALQQPTIIGPTEAVGFDYLDADLTAYIVTSFEACWDSAACVSIGIPPPRVLADTSSGASTYAVIPPFTGGTHTVKFRAVNLAGPGGASAPLEFAYVGSPPTGVPANVRKVPRGGG